MPKSVATAVSPANRIPTTDESRWLDHLKHWREAHVSLAAYARSANLKIHRLYAWKSRLETRGLWKDRLEGASFIPACACWIRRVSTAAPPRSPA